jgi:hypothetical protein
VVVAVFDVHEFKAQTRVLGQMGHRRDFLIISLRIFERQDLISFGDL